MELVDVYNIRGEKLHYKKSRDEEFKGEEHRLYMELWLLNSAGELLVQKRAGSREVLPDTWGMTTGHAVAGEDTLKTCIREAREELGIGLDKNDIYFLKRLIHDNSLWDIYIARKNICLEDISIQKEEVSNAAFVSIEKLKGMIKEGFVYEYPEIFEIISLVKGYIEENISKKT